MDYSRFLLASAALLLLLTAYFAARRWTSWWSLLLVLLFPYVGFLFVLWDVWKETEETDAPLASEKGLAPLFDRREHGVVWTFVAAVFIAALLLRAVNALATPLFFDGAGLPLSLQALYLTEAMVAAAIGLLLFHLVARDWLLALGWGAAELAATIFVVTVAPRLDLEGVSFPGLEAWRPLLSAFIHGLLFMGGVIACVRVWGVRARSFILGGVAGQLLFGQGVLRLMYDQGSDVEVILYGLTNNVLAGVLYGGLIYAALRLHFRSGSFPSISPPPREAARARPGPSVPSAHTEPTPAPAAAGDDARSREDRNALEEEVRDLFGPPSEEEEGEGEGAPSHPPEGVTFRTKTTEEGPLGLPRVHEFFTAVTKKAALAFLGNTTVKEAFHYVVVETPEGTWAKDSMGVVDWSDRGEEKPAAGDREGMGARGDADTRGLPPVGQEMGEGATVPGIGHQPPSPPTPPGRAAAERLAEAPEEERVSMAMELLTSPDPTVRAAVAGEVARLGIRGVGALYEMANALADDMEEVRSAAAAAFWRLESVAYAIRSMRDEHAAPSHMSREEALRGLECLRAAAPDEEVFAELVAEHWPGAPQARV